MGDFLDRGVDDERAARERDEALEGKLAFKEPGQMKSEQRLGQCIEQSDDDEEQDDPESDREADAPLANHRRFLFANAF